jgi:hypothetical protein
MIAKALMCIRVIMPHVCTVCVAQDEAASRVHVRRSQMLADVGDDMLGLIKLLHDSAQVST